MAPERLAPWQHLAAGTCSGAFSSAATFPLDVLKTRLQAATTSTRRAQSLGAAFARIARVEGYRGLYSGLSPALLGNAMAWGGYFYFYEHAKRRQQRSTTAPPTFAQHSLAAGEAGFVMVFLTCPIWVIKTRMQLQRQARGEAATSGAPEQQQQRGRAHYRGVADAVRTIYREEGLAGLYRGTVPSLFLVSHGMIQFVTYERLKEWSEPGGSGGSGGAHSTAQHLTMGACSKVVASVSTYPVQVIKTRLQQRASASSNTPRYSGMLDCATQIAKFEGWRGFYRGIVPNTLRVVPSTALTFAAYEQIASQFRGRAEALRR